MRDNQFIKIATISPKLVVANPQTNIEIILEEINKLKAKSPHFIVFPELAVSGYTSQDLLFQTYLLDKTKKAIKYFLDNNNFENIVIFGAPYLFKDSIYNCAFVVKKNKVLGIVPKSYLPNYDEFYEKRYFQSAFALGDETFYCEDYDTYFNSLIFYEQSKDLTFGIEICEDMWAPISPSSYLSINGCQIIFNLSASNEVLNKDDLRRNIVTSISRRNNCAYVYVSSGRYESTQDTVFSNHSIVACNGLIIDEAKLFNKSSSQLVCEIDLSYLKFIRRKNSTLKDSFILYKKEYRKIVTNNLIDLKYSFEKELSKTPFVPSINLQQTFTKILNIQVASLAKRIEHTNVETVVVGVSGGLDSTLALLVLVETFKFLNKDLKGILAVTMPGFGTSDRTLKNATNLIKYLNVTFKLCDIKASVTEHFKVINHDMQIKDITYENAQARERTNILMNLANKHRGFVLGTGNLSELALGWCTFNGDQMSNYSINGGLPKTLVKFMVNGFSDYIYTEQTNIKEIILDVLNTPISPELTSSKQNTEDIIGKYEINDFIIYRMLVCGDNEDRIRYLLEMIFNKDLSKEEINKYLKTFYSRFFSQQFKRSTLPDGPKILDISLSPRTDFRMPSDAMY